MATKAELAALLRECQEALPDGIHSDMLHRRIDAALAEPEGETVRVRAAVMLNDSGSYIIVGGKHPSEEVAEETMVRDMHADFGEVFGPSRTIHFIEADVPLPKPTTVEGEVSE